jgi:hypothetical protein
MLYLERWRVPPRRRAREEEWSLSAEGAPNTAPCPAETPQVTSETERERERERKRQRDRQTDTQTEQNAPMWMGEWILSADGALNTAPCPAETTQVTSNKTHT